MLLAAACSLAAGFTGSVLPSQRLRPHLAPAAPHAGRRCAPLPAARGPLVRMEQRIESPPAPPGEMTDSQDAFKAAMTQTGILFGAALAFCSGVFLVQGQEPATAWFAAYILEESLSIDNLFVFSLIFDYFQTPLDAQPRVLRWGLIVAVVLRAAFIFAGLAVVEQFKGAPSPALGHARAGAPLIRVPVPADLAHRLVLLRLQACCSSSPAY